MLTQDLNFISSSGNLTVYSFVYGHGSRRIAKFCNIDVRDVPDFVDKAISEFLSKTRFPLSKKVFSYKFEC